MATENKTKVNPTQTPKVTKPKGPSKLPVICVGITIFVLLGLLAFAIFKYKATQKNLTKAVDVIQQLEHVENQCQDTNSICIYGKTTAVDDYLLLISRTLQTKQSTSYDIMLEIVPSKLAEKGGPTNTDCRPNNHYLYICQRMTSTNPKKLVETLVPAYDALNPNIEYNVALIMVPRATLIADDSNPQNMQMAPNNVGADPNAAVQQPMQVNNPEAGTVNPNQQPSTSSQVQPQVQGEQQQENQQQSKQTNQSATPTPQPPNSFE